MLEAVEHGVALRVGLAAGQPLPQDDVVVADVRRTRSPSGRGHRRRRVDGAVLAQRVDPLELGLDLARRAVAGPVDAQRVAARRVGVLDAVGVVLGDVAERGRRLRREAEARERRLGQLVHAHPSLPLTPSSTRVISSRARTISGVEPAR